ncbi:MAG: CBS domain-containing protein [Candidatus Iainarchaeum archaeon]|uniref:CBS domain-containing protein n=1 Tax=Candidatus Iainarchaeum sp. TaxID=3101447 RepID=A0A7T9DK20_9ARCH|nr:MAG: CBS domain-containing protein [Candidatus Diapherotrites archaeon]
MPENTTQLRVQDIMTTSFVRADVKDSISSLLASMKKGGAETAIVFNGKKFAGIVSHSGLLRNVDVQKTKVSTIVQTAPRLALNQSFDDAVKQMRNANAHALAVIEKENVVGVVNVQELLGRMKNSEQLRTIKASEMATMQPLFATEKDELGKVVRQLKQGNIRKVPVLNDRGKVTGVLKMDSIALDVLLPMDRNSDDSYKLDNSSQTISKKNIFAIPVKSVMDENPIMVRGNETGNKVADMLARQTNPLLILSDNGMHGIISVQNVFNAYLNQTQSDTQQGEANSIQTTHLPDVDEIDKAKIDSMITKTFNKMQRIMKGELRMNVVYKQTSKAGMRAKTEVNIKVQGTGRPFSAHAEDWKVLLATKEACSALENEISKRYKQRDTGRKR